MNWKKIPLFFLAFTIASVFTACNPEGAEYIDELDLVITVRNNDADFAPYSKFAMADTVMFLSNSANADLSVSESDFIINEVGMHFKEFGWTEVDTTVEAPDVLVLVSVLEDVSVSYFTNWWDYWYGWGGWGYYPGYPGGYYPYYPGWGGSYTTIYTYREGTLLVEMVDPNNPIPSPSGSTATLPVLWAGAINGLLEGSKSSINNRVEKALDQMFKDSPYLDKK